MTPNRRQFMKSVVGLVALSVGHQSASAQESGLGHPRVPDSLSEQSWSFDTASSSNEHFEYSFIGGTDTEAANSATKTLGENVKPFGYYAARMKQIRQPDSGETGSVCLGSLCAPFDFPDFSWFSNDKKDKPDEMAKSLFEDWLSSEYTGDLDEESGINGNGWNDDTDYTNPDTEISGKWTYTFRTNINAIGNGLRQRAVLALQTPNSGRTYTVVGAVFPAEHFGFGSDEIEYNLDKVETQALQRMRNTGG